MDYLIRIDHHEQDKTALLLHAVEPALAAFAGMPEAPQAWVRAHWKFGPHLNLHLRFTHAPAAERLLPQLVARLQAWLDAHPSPTQLDPVHYERQSAALGRAEKEAGPYLPLSPNNRVSVTQAAPTPMMGVAAIGLLRDRLLADALPLVFDLLRLRAETPVLYQLMLGQMMVCVAELAVKGGAREGHLSFRGHAEAFLGTLPGSRAEFVRLSDSLAPRLKDRLVPLLDDLGLGRLPREPLLRRWVLLLRPLLARARAVVAGEYANIDLGLGTGDPGAAPASPLAAALRQPRVIAKLNDPDYVPYRVLINQFYLLLPLLAVSPAQRFCLCHIVADACQDIYGIDWQPIFFPAQVEN